MDRATAIKKVKEYANLVTSKYSTDMIILFGSYAKGNFSENSDIDVAIIVNSFSGDFLNVSTTLCKLTRNIDYRIEPVLIDMNNDKSGFAHDILQYGIIIYDKNSTQRIDNMKGA
jgi:uncharacterized protein